MRRSKGEWQKSNKSKMGDQRGYEQVWLSRWKVGGENMRNFPFPATEEKERAAGEGKRCEPQLGGRGQLLQLGFVHRSSMWCNPSCWGQLHRHSGEVCQGNMSFLISKDMWEIFCVCLSARHKAAGQGNIFSWTDVTITKNMLSFVNGHFTQSNTSEMIRKEKLGLVLLLPEAPWGITLLN